jgi:hypothetical protein
MLRSTQMIKLKNDNESLGWTNLYDESGNHIGDISPKPDHTIVIHRDKVHSLHLNESDLKKILRKIEKLKQKRTR